MMQPALELFDRELALGDLLTPACSAAVAQALSSLLDGCARLLDLEGRVVAGEERPGGAEYVTIPLHVQMDTVGYLEARGPLARAQAAAALIEQILLAGARYCMAADLHVEAMRSDYQRLQEEHAALLASEARYRELAQTLDQRVQAQVRTIEDSQRSLYQAERLAAVGQLAAGVAHEINNPMGFIRSNLNTAAGYTARLAELEPLIEADQGAASALWRRAQMTEMLRDFDALLEESVAGVDRVTRIVADLKTFSGTDRDEVEPLDLTENLRIVCSVAEAQLRDGTRIELDLQPLPLFECERARINQAFLNVLLNAVQALGPGGVVRISSSFSNAEIRIVFADDGCGMTPEVLSRVYDPFFTTRGVGAGTGLGLTVTRDIVRGYDGMLDIASEAGSGTRVVIRLPVSGRS